MIGFALVLFSNIYITNIGNSGDDQSKTGMAHCNDVKGYYWMSPKVREETTDGQARGNGRYNKKNRKGKRPAGQYGGK